MRDYLRFWLLGKGQINRLKLGLRNLRVRNSERERESENVNVIKTDPEHDSA